MYVSVKERDEVVFGSRSIKLDPGDYPLVRKVRKLFMPDRKYCFSEEKKLKSVAEIQRERLKTLKEFSYV